MGPYAYPHVTKAWHHARTLQRLSEWGLNTSMCACALDSFHLSRRVLYMCMATFSWRSYSLEELCDYALYKITITIKITIKLHLHLQPTGFALLKHEVTRRMGDWVTWGLEWVPSLRNADVLCHVTGAQLTLQCTSLVPHGWGTHGVPDRSRSRTSC